MTSHDALQLINKLYSFADARAPKEDSVTATADECDARDLVKYIRWSQDIIEGMVSDDDEREERDRSNFERNWQGG